tara:strand:+ start:4533 stop:5225 length:693 start_codon:yes stop_codon:yes gene_type:complete
MYNKRKQRYNKIEINTDLDEELLDNFAPLSAWKENMKMNLVKNGAHIEDVNIINGYKFGPRLGFVYMEAKVKYEDKYIPGVVLLRGPSCAVLMWYKKDNNIFVLMIEQPRTAIGKLTWEVPAGMVDGEENIKGKMFDEIYEETGIISNDVNNLIPLGKTYSSCGILDEEIYLYSLNIDSSCVQDLHPGNCGIDDEIITNISVFDINNAPTSDMKFLALRCRADDLGIFQS